MAATETVHHPCFARICQRVSAAAMQKGEAEFRREMLAGLAGRVIEVGAGHGWARERPQQSGRASAVSADRPHG